MRNLSYTTKFQELHKLRELRKQEVISLSTKFKFYAKRYQSQKAVSIDKSSNNPLEQAIPYIKSIRKIISIKEIKSEQSRDGEKKSERLNLSKCKSDFKHFMMDMSQLKTHLENSKVIQKQLYDDKKRFSSGSQPFRALIQKTRQKSDATVSTDES